MPTYDYRCKECGHTFEAFQMMTDPTLTECPRCHAPALERLIGGGAGLLFKGSGFYLTDYKKTGSSSAGSHSHSASHDGAGKASSSTSESGSTASSGGSPTGPAKD